MKTIFILLGTILVLLSACTTGQGPKDSISTNEEGVKMVSEPVVEPVVLNGDELVKQSLLSSLYERKLVTIKDDSIFCRITFDQHGSCLAPDNYGAHLSFSFLLKSPLELPAELLVQEEEFNEMGGGKRSMNFKLQASTKEFVLYKAAETMESLAIFKAAEKTGNHAFYFTGKDEITGENIYNMLENAYEDGEQVVIHANSSSLKAVYE